MKKEKILVFTKNWLGEVIFESPALKAIKSAFPDSELVCVAPKRCQAILENYPYVDHVLPFDEKKKERSFREKWARVREWRSEGFTRAFIFHRSFTRVLLTWLAGIPYRAGFRTKGRGFFLTHGVALPPAGLHDTDYYLHPLKQLGLPAELGTPCEFYYSNHDEVRMLRTLQRLGIAKNDFFVFHTGANWEPKRWPSEKFLELIQLLQARESTPVLLTGTPDDKDRVADLVKSAQEAGLVAHSLAGETSLGELGALFSFARAVVSNDSGPLHIAGGVGAKTVALFGPTDPKKTGPRGRGRTVLIQKTRMEDIEPQEVIRALEKLQAFLMPESLISL